MKRILASAVSIMIVLLGTVNAAAYDACCPSQLSDDAAETLVMVIEPENVSVDFDKANMPCHEMDQGSFNNDVSCCDCLAATSVAIIGGIHHSSFGRLMSPPILHDLSVYNFLPEFSSPPPKLIA